MGKLTTYWHLVIPRERRWYVLFHLLWNYICLLKLKLYKWMRGIKQPIIHYYAVCWNEERILPYVLDYYKRFVDEFFIYDNYSSDKSVEIIQSYDHTHVFFFETEGFSDTVHMNIKNSVWKQSRGRADYVVVCDMDELLYADDVKIFLNQVLTNHYSYFVPNGYNMYAKAMPEYKKGIVISDELKRGVEAENFSKAILFDPHRIVEINYTPGCHSSSPIGIVKKYHSPDFKLLHYKYIDIDYLIARHSSYAQRLSADNLANNYGIEYLKKIEQLQAEYEQGMREAKEII